MNTNIAQEIGLKTNPRKKEGSSMRTGCRWSALCHADLPPFPSRLQKTMVASYDLLTTLYHHSRRSRAFRLDDRSGVDRGSAGPGRCTRWTSRRERKIRHERGSIKAGRGEEAVTMATNIAMVMWFSNFHINVGWLLSVIDMGWLIAFRD
jgi:hypothetical protein